MCKRIEASVVAKRVRWGSLGGRCQARQENAHPPKYLAVCEIPVSELVVVVNHHGRMLASDIQRPLHHFHCSLPRSRDGVGMTMRQ